MKIGLQELLKAEKGDFTEIEQITATRGNL